MPKSKTPQAIYQFEKKRAEKERRANHAALMKDAKAAFDQMIEDGKAARKGAGRRVARLASIDRRRKEKRRAERLAALLFR